MTASPQHPSAPSAAAPATPDPGSRPRGRRPGRGSEPPATGAAAADRETDAHEVARTIALRQLTMAPRSRSQLEDKLRQKGCDEQVATEVLDRLEEVGLIDDTAYAQMLVRSQQASRGLARRALRHELRKKGVDDDTAAEALDQVSDEAEAEQARELVAKKLRSMHGLDATVQARRLAGMRARKGYGGDVAWRVVREAVDGAEEHRRD